MVGYITRDEIDRRWSRSALSEGESEIPERTVVGAKKCHRRRKLGAKKCSKCIALSAKKCIFAM